MFLGFFFGKSLVGKDILRTFASAFAQKRVEALKKEFFERFTQTEVVQEANACFRHLGMKKRTVNDAAADAARRVKGAINLIPEDSRSGTE